MLDSSWACRCFWQRGDMPRSTKVWRRVAPQIVHTPVRTHDAHPRVRHAEQEVASLVGHDMPQKLISKDVSLPRLHLERPATDALASLAFLLTLSDLEGRFRVAFPVEKVKDLRSLRFKDLVSFVHRELARSEVRA